ncbi:MAG: ABC transporter permease [Hyphomicrobiaceae bacterium]
MAGTAVRKMSGSGWRLAWVCVFLLFLYLPIMLMPLFSFNDGIYVAFPLKGFTTKWYAQLFANEALAHALVNSLKVAIAASLISTGLAIFAAKAFTRYEFKGRQLGYGLIMAPMILPEIMVGISLFLIILALGLPLGLYTVLFGHVLFCMPFAISVLSSRLEGFDKSLEEASLDLGESPLMTFWRVTFPLTMPGIVSSLLLCFTISFDEFILAFFLSSTETTLPVYIWGQLRFPAKLPEVLALGSLILVGTTILIVAAQSIRGEEGMTQGR